MEAKMKLYGFNNLTKSLSFNIYDVCSRKRRACRRNTLRISTSSTFRAHHRDHDLPRGADRREGLKRIPAGL